MDRVELKIYKNTAVTQQSRNNPASWRTVVDKWKFQDAMMGEQYVTFTITSEKPIDWAVGDYCIFRGETFTLNYVPSVTQKAGTNERLDAYTYENVKFESYREELTRCIMLDITPSTGLYAEAFGTNYTGSSKFQLFCGETTISGQTLTAVCALVTKIQANLDRMYGSGTWTIQVDTETTYTDATGNTVLATHTDDQVLSFDNTTVAKALEEVHNTFDLDYCIKGRNIKIGFSLHNLTSDNANEVFSFGYGKGYPRREDMNHGLFQIKRIANPQQKIVTRLRAFGSTKNIPYRYYNKAYNLSQSLFPTNLQLPDTFENASVKAAHNATRDTTYGVTDIDENTHIPNLRHVKGATNDAYIDKNDDAESCLEGIREESARWDGTDGNLPEIYPTIEGATYGELRGAGVTDQDGGSFANYDNNERIDKLLAVGRNNNGVLVNDANKGDGILPESGISSKGILRPASLGKAYPNYNTFDYGDFTPRGNLRAAEERTLFTINGVLPGKYELAPTANSVYYGFSLSCHADGCSADVGFIITIKQKSQSTGAVTTLGTYTSSFQNVSRSSGPKEIELPRLPDVENGANAQISEINVTVLSDIIVTFTPIIRNIVVPSGFTDNFCITYQVGNSSINNANQYEPEYTWISADDSETLTDIFHIYIQDMGFDLEACFTGDTPVMSMKSGRCVGREFEIMENIQKVTYSGKKGYMLTLKRAQDSSLNTYYPSQNDPLAAGDYFVLLNINMPDVFIKAAEVRLLRAATQYLADNCETQFTYQPSIDDIYLQRNYDKMVKAGTPEASVFWRLYAGLKFMFRGVPSSADAPAPLADITIEKVTISMGEGLTPKVELTLNDDVQQGTIQKLTTNVDRIYNGSIFNGGSGSGATIGAMSAALYSILQSEGEKLFLSKTKDDAAEGKITFKDVVTFDETLKAKRGVKIGNFQSRLLGSGAIIDENGNAEFESIYSRNFISTPEFRFNRIAVTEGEQWCTNGFGTIEKVDIIDDTTGYITLKLEQNDYASIKSGDICRGIYNDIARQYETANLDDDSELYEGLDEQGSEGFGFSSKEGFFTSYFWVKQMITNKKGECVFLYELRNTSIPHPCEFMKFAQYGSFTDPERRSSSYATSIGHYYEMVLDGVSTWKIQSENVVYRKGYLGDMTIHDNVRGDYQLQGYGLYVQDNVYFGNAVIQLDPVTLAQLREELNSYIVEFSEHVDVITVDDVGNIIGGIYTVSGANNEYRQYLISSAITVRKGGVPLVIAADNADAAAGTYKIYAEAHGCSFVIEDSTICITHINNTKDGIAGTSDDVNFDYDAMRNMTECRVDLIIDCEGRGSIQKKFPIRIKHDAQPFVGADLSNQYSGLSWNTQNQLYIGLPITFDVQMWHNNEFLDVTGVGLTCSAANILVTSNGFTSATTAADTTKIQCTIQPVSITKNGKTFVVGRVTITGAPQNLPLVVPISVSATAVYAGSSYERTLTHTINKSTDTNVYSLIPSVDEIVISNGGTLSTNSLTCGIVCDSSNQEHYNVTVGNNGKNTTHGLYLCWKKRYANGTEDATETDYTGSVSVSADVKEVVFTLYALNSNGTPNKLIVHDQESVPVISAGVDGKSVEFVFFRQNAETPKPTLYDASQDSTKDSGQTKTRAELFQEDNYCPFTSAANYGSQSEQWTDEPQGIGQNERFEFYAERKKVNGVWQPFSAVHLWNRYATDGQSSYIIDLTNENSFVNCETDGTPLVGALYETSEVLILFGITDKRSDFNIKVVPTNISCNGYYPRGGTAVSGQTECPQGGFTLPINGSYVLTPSDIKEGAATIAVTATHKTNSNIVLVATYKINKNMAGQTGVIYSLIPSLNVIQKNLDGTFRDTTLNVQVKKTRGTTTELLSTYKDIADEGLTLSYENNHASSPFALVASGATSTSNVSVASSTFVNDSGSGTYGKLILKKNNVVADTERINVVKDGKDGVSQPFYIDSEEAWYDSSTSHPAESSSAWSKTTPTKNGKYLWRRTRKMVLNSAGTGYTPASAQDGGSWSYQLLSGTDGTSVNVKGTVATVAALSNINNPQDGDAYKCEADGHLYMWSTEANNWIDLGQFKGEDGDNVHIAWADNVTISNGNVTSVTGFTIGVGSNGDGKSWMGVCIDKNAADPTTYASYTWRYVKGEQGVDAGEREWIYKRQSSSTASIPSSSGTGTVNGVSTVYGNTIDDWVPSGWTDNPQGVTINEPYEFACYRDKARGATTWGPFVGVQGSPLLWSHYGERGTDGDGVEYVFIRTKKNVAPTLDSTQNGYDTDDFCPQASVSNDYVKGQESGNTLTTATCTDDPVGTSETWPYEWVAKRTKTAAVNGVRSWTKYTEMSLWANWSKDGVSVQSYIKTWEAWSDSESDPTIDVSTWGESTPAKTKKYLWRRSLLMTLNAAGTDYEGALNSQNQPDYKYQMLSGTDGTSIKPKGNVIYVASSSGSLPSSNVAANSLAIVVSSQKLYKYNSGWSQVSANSADGDCYVVTGECTYGGENVKGFMFMWSDESGAWIPLGQFKGEEGVTYYTHIAWTDDVDTAHPWTGDLPAGQTSTPSVSSASYVGGTNGHFSVSPQEGYDWMGICINTTKTDPPSSQRHYYTWKYTKGERGVDASDREWIYLQSDSATAPNIPASSGTGTVNGVATAYANTVDDWVPAGWTDSPLGVTDSMPYEYACYRDKERGGSTWSVFKGTNGKALLWSHYGQRGTDGDGVEYVFVRTKENVAPEVPSSGTYSEGSQGYDSDDHLPYVRIAKTKDIKGYNGGEGTTSGDYKYVKCTDDPVGTDSTWKFEWVLKRTKGSASNGVRSWNAYSGSMSLWANWSKDGEDGQDGQDGQDGADGADGEDGNGIAGITTTYAISEYGTNYNGVETNPPSDLQPYSSSQWYASSPAATTAKPFLWRREYTLFTDGTSTTKYYCIGKLGEAGIDGPGSEWVYIRTTSNTPPVLLNDANYSDSHQTPRDYDEDDFLPRVDTSQRTDIEGWDNPNFPGECSDDPKGVSELWPFEWEAKRMKLLNQAGTAREWQKYYDAMGNSHQMALHKRWSKDAATLVFTPAIVTFRADADGNVNSGQSFASLVQLQLPDGTTATPTLSNDSASTDASCSSNGNVITVAVSESGYEASDIEGYYSVTGTATVNGITYTAKGSLKITVTRDGRNGTNGTNGTNGQDGSPGATGPSFYPAGEYDDSVAYVVTGDLRPFVLWNGDYYYLKRDSQGNSPSNTTYWGLASRFKMIMTEALFADFAKFGSAIMSGDYMFSQIGRIGSTVYNDGDEYNSVPAYTYFRGDPDGRFNVGKLNGSTSTSASSQYPNVLNTLSLSKGQTLTVVLNVTSQYGTATIGVRTVGGSSFISSQSWSQGTTAEKTLTMTASSVMEVEIVLSTSGQGTSVIGSGYYYFSPVFVPNWWVDLKTGKMSAINVDVQGTIRATSFYRNMNFGDNSKVWKHVWSDGTEDITETYYSSGDDAWDSSEGVYLLSQTYYGNADTDIFYVNNEDVFIPNPDNWEGKQVEIYNAGASSNGSMRVKSNNNTRSTLMRWPLMSAFSGDLSCGDASYIRMVCRRDNGYNYWYIIEYRRYDGKLYLPNV